jgi:hypothetical protein
MSERRFPAPWSAEVTPNCFIVRDADGQQLAYVYYESEPGRRSAAKMLSKDEARRIAIDLDQQPYWKLGVPYHAMAQDHQLPPVQLSHENAEVERLRIRSERMELIARALETLARSRELLVKADEALSRKWTASSPCP